MRNALTIIILIFTINILVGQKPKFKDVTKEELLKESSSIDSMAKAEYLYKGCEVKFEFNKSSGRFDVYYYHHQRIKIYNNDNNNIANVLIRYYKGESRADSEKVDGLEAYTFNLESKKIVKEKLSKNNIYDVEENKYYSNKKFAFPAVTDGSVLELKYTLKSQYYFNVDEFYFQSDIPVKYTEYTIGVPEYFNYNVNLKGLVQLDVNSKQASDNFNYSYIVKNNSRTAVQSLGSRQIKQDRRSQRINYNKKVTTYRASDIPAIKNEPYVYSMDNYKSSIRHELLSTKYPESTIKYYTKTWDDIAEILENSNKFGGQLNSNYKQYKELLASVSEMDTLEKINTIYQKVKSQFVWNGYLGHYSDEGIKEMIKKGSGNIVEINLLLVNLLRKAGLDSNPMVSRESKSGFLNITNPSISQLNYVTAIVKVSGKYIYLDASDKNLHINELPNRALNLKGILISGGKGYEMWVNNPNSGKENRIYSLSINGESLEGIYKQTIKNYAAYSTRKRYVSESDFVSSLDSEEKTITNCSVENYNSISDIKVVGDVSTNGHVQYIDDKIFLNLDVCDENFNNPFKSSSRDFSIFFDSRFSNVDMLKIKIPEGYKVESIPEKLNIATPDQLLTIMINFSVVNGEIAMTKKMKLAETIINPSYYKSLKMVYDQLEAKLKEKIVLAKI